MKNRVNTKSLGFDLIEIDLMLLSHVWGNLRNPKNKLFLKFSFE